jgi:CubicO group peptidase (beta-lactamase class C family)
MNKNIRFLLTLLAGCMLLMQQPKVNAMETTNHAQQMNETLSLDDPQAVAAFVDDYFTTQMAELHVPGTAVTIVKDNQILFAKGYGMANLAQQTPVDVSSTLFRAGSVSKLFTATAVMQLVEQGKLDLDGDVNQYLRSFQLENKYDKPVTVADLLLHTAGFDDVFLGMHARTEADYQPLGVFLESHMPGQYDPPGELISYNDHSMSLAGLLVEEVSGQSFESYIADHILAPLGMTNSSFNQPLPPELANNLAIGYAFDGQDYKSYEWDFLNVSPAAALHGTAEDMAAFMIAHLNGGEAENGRILQPETTALMHQTHFSHHPALRGRAYGFSEWRENGQRALYHDGGNPGFLSRLLLLPEENVGFYITYNADQNTSASRLHREFTTQFLNAFFPDVSDTTPRPQLENLSHPASDYAGYYRDVPAYSRDTLQKFASLPNQFSIKANGDQIAVFGRDYAEVEPLLFQSRDGERFAAFREDASGHITHFFSGTGAFIKLKWYESQPFHLGLAAWFLVSFVTAVFFSVFWRSGTPVFRLGLGAWSLLNLAFLIGMAVVMMQIQTDPWEFLYGPPPAMVALLVVPLLTTALAVAVAWLTISGWGNWPVGVRVVTAVYTLTAITFPLFLNYWKLLGFQY